MNVTRHNFSACFADLQSAIADESCKFIAIDTEFTGLSPSEDERERFLGVFTVAAVVVIAECAVMLMD